MSLTSYRHRMAAHCETGTVAGQLSHAGLEISEPLVFGIASGIFFGYFDSRKFPFPTFVVRVQPGKVRTAVEKRLGVKFATKTFRKPGEGEAELDRLLESGVPVSCQTDFFYMDYLPRHVRVHINVHFVTIVGREDDRYIVSDCYSPELASIDSGSLAKARFAGGSFAPRGFLFYPSRIPDRVPWEQAIVKGIKRASFYMTRLPIPFLGVKGIHLFADRVVTWPRLARDMDHLSHEIMKINVLLEDQGTGGAGFRFMYAAFLKEAAPILKDERLADMSRRMMEIGDRWREVSLFAARAGKRRDLGEDRLKELGRMIHDRADEEDNFFRELYRMMK